MAKLTKSLIEGATARDSAYFVWCSELPGFGIRVFPTGKKTFYADYYNSDGQRKRMSIGPYGKLTLDEGRKLARITLGSVLAGEDPALERKTRRSSITVSELCDDYIAAVEKGLVLGKGRRPKKPSTLATDKGRIERHIKPLLGRKLVIDVKQSDISKFIRDVTTGKTAAIEKTEKLRGKAIVEGGAGTASRTAGLLGGILSFAMSEGIIEANPARGVKRPNDGQRQRRLDAAEYAALGKVLADGSEPWQAVACVKLLAFTGCRRGEIEGLKWSEVDIEGKALRLSDSKTGASIRPLGQAAVDVLRGIERKKGVDYVLPGVRDESKPYGGLAGAMERIMKAAKLDGVTAHTLRHSFASVGADLDFSDSTIGACLGHSGSGITSRYIHRLDTVLIAAADKIACEVERQMSAMA
ncbi:tyrosine-type recombinase/integrase [Aminobacter sp. P9b]|uniref:tyrosine-type recombinase/integrase n=1 Tax=Aminobacter sp. P9b TaxID=3133697 RepID=UPI00324C49D5